MDTITYQSKKGATEGVSWFSTTEHTGNQDSAKTPPVQLSVLTYSSTGSRQAERDALRRSKSRTPLRRYIGFVISFEDDTANVILEDSIAKNGQIEYSLPASYLRKSEITKPNQPFEMTEFQVNDPTEVGKTYIFKPLASAEGMRRQATPWANKIEALISARKNAKV